jgi:dolichyl-phosphate beta-glucosyltransferase
LSAASSLKSSKAIREVSVPPPQEPGKTLKEKAVHPFYTIVIPAYNEEARLGATLERVLAFVNEQSWDAEVLVVDDGSTDQTAEIVRSYAERDSAVRLLENPGNRGKGYSVRNGVMNARGAIILFTDADLSSPIEESQKLLAALDAGADIAIGSRWLRGELQRQRQSLARQVLGRAFNQFLRILLRLDFKDTQCGFKAFRRSAARAVFPPQKIGGWGFDAEILFLARRFGFQVAEVPVVWAHCDGTRINPIADGLSMVTETMRIRWYALSGAYARPVRAQAAGKLSNVEMRRD